MLHCFRTGSNTNRTQLNAQQQSVATAFTLQSLVQQLCAGVLQLHCRRPSTSEAAAASLAGSASSLQLAPVSPSLAKPSHHMCQPTHPPVPHQGLMHMARTEGMRGMMKGNWTNCVRIIPNSAMKFFTYEQLSR